MLFPESYHSYSAKLCANKSTNEILLFRPEMVVGWYHSHPGFGCWLSGVDINTQQSFEALSERAVAVVVDPIQSVKGKVKILHLSMFVMLLSLLEHLATYAKPRGPLTSLALTPPLGCYRCVQVDQCQHDGAGS